MLADTKKRAIGEGAFYCLSKELTACAIAKLVERSRPHPRPKRGKTTLIGERVNFE